MTSKATLGRQSKKMGRPCRPATGAGVSIGQHLIQRLQDVGLRHVFGIPGDYVLQFYSMLEASPIEVIGTTREDNAGYAADAYARVNGIGAVCVTYCVGGLSICNSVAGAFAEKSPVIVISGAPGVSERTSNPLLHHRVRDFSTQRDVFERLTIAGAELNDPLTAFREIDRVIDSAVRYKRPVYLELPRDMVNEKPPREVVSRPGTDHRTQFLEHSSDRAGLAEALDEATRLIAQARQPVILAGVEVHRFGLQRDVVRLAERYDIPIATTLLGKSAVSETHPLHIGIYAAAIGRPDVKKYVEQSDCVIMLGAFLTDIDSGIAAPALDAEHCISATSEQLRIRHHHFHDILLADFVRGLAKPGKKRQSADAVGGAHRDGAASRPVKKTMSLPKAASPGKTRDRAITVTRLFDWLGSLLTDDMLVIADIGDSLIGAIDLVTHRQTEFLGMAYYTSMGFSVPAALGAGVADRKRRAVVITGDGAFQMTGMELSTIVRHGLNPIVIVLNNGGYGTERLLHPGSFAFNDIHNWEYHRLPDVLGGGRGFDVKSEAEFESAMQSAADNHDSFSLLNVHIDSDDHSAALGRLAKRLSRRV